MMRKHFFFVLLLLGAIHVYGEKPGVIDSLETALGQPGITPQHRFSLLNELTRLN